MPPDGFAGPDEFPQEIGDVPPVNAVRPLRGGRLARIRAATMRPATPRPPHEDDPARPVGGAAGPDGLFHVDRLA